MAALEKDLFGGRTDVVPESTVDASVTSDMAVVLGLPTRGGIWAGRMNVRWLEATETLETLDFGPCFDVDLEIRDESCESESLDPGLSSSALSLTEIGVSDLSGTTSGLFLCAERSVSGGEGGRSSFLVSFRVGDAFRVVPGESADLDLRISLPPRSVASGVSGSVRRAPADTSSLL